MQKKLRRPRRKAFMKSVLPAAPRVNRETVVEAVQGGSNDYVVKPYTADLIAQRLKK